MKKYKTNQPHPGDHLMVVLRNDDVDLSASNRHKLTDRDAVYFFCACVEPLGYKEPADPKGKPYSILEFYSNEEGDHGCVNVCHGRLGQFDYAYGKYTYEYCDIVPAAWAREHGYPTKLRARPPTYTHPDIVVGRVTSKTAGNK